MLDQQITINCGGQLLDLSIPKVMGILNVTPDSFYDGGRFNSDKAILKQAEKLIYEGAAIIDVGGISTRPGAEIVEASEEIDRVIPVIGSLTKTFPEVIISVDTFRSEVAKAAIESGVSMINDISAGRFDEQFFSTIGSLQVPYVLMHMQGTPETMQINPTYNNVVQDVVDFMIKKVGDLRNEGVKDIIVDPGFGFGKSLEHNFSILKNMHALKILGLPILAGLSRKSMICKSLKVSPKCALNGTTALHMIALQQGAKILRVHDVKEAIETIELWQHLEAV